MLLGTNVRLLGAALLLGVGALVILGAFALLQSGDGVIAKSETVASGATEPGKRATPSTRVGSEEDDLQPRPVRMQASDSQQAEAELPADLEQAIELNPEFGKDLDCRDNQARFNTDYRLRLIANLRGCLAGRTKSTGRLDFMLHFDNDPERQEATGTDLTPKASELSPGDDQIVLECLRAIHRGSLLQLSEKYGQGSSYHMVSNLNLPLENSHVFFEIREGSYTAGTNFGCEVP